MFYRISFCGYFPARENQTVFVLAMLRSGNIGLRFMLPIVEFGWKDAKFATSFPSMWYKCTVYLTGGVLQM